MTLPAQALQRAWSLRRSPFLGNLAALTGSLAAVALATLLVARASGPAGVGQYALLRVLPWLLAVMVSSGLPYAISYFLAGPSSKDPRVRPTILPAQLRT